MRGIGEQERFEDFTPLFGPKSSNLQFFSPIPFREGGREVRSPTRWQLELFIYTGKLDPGKLWSWNHPIFRTVSVSPPVIGKFFLAIL